MKKLIEMSHLVTDFIDSNKLKHLFKQDTYDPKAYKLLDGIITGKYADDKEAAYDLYKTSPESKSYLMLKSRTRDRMLNLLFTMNKTKRLKSTLDKEMFICIRNLTAARLLISRGMRNVAVDFLKDVFTRSVKFQFTDMVLLSARLLRYQESFAGSEKKMIYYNDIIKKTKELLDAEMETEELFQKISVLSRKSIGPKEKIKEVASQSYKRSKELIRKFKSHILLINTFRISIFYEHMNNHHEKVIEICDECEKYLKSTSAFNDYPRIAEIALQKLDTSLYLRNYELGKTNATTCKKLYKSGSINWFIFLEYYFLLCLHTKNIHDAQATFNEVIRDPKFSNYPAERLEKWKIFEAYLSYILPEKARQKRFNVFRFINEVPIFSKDKRGYNLSIIIAQIALLIKLGDFDKVMDKFDSLKSYASRYVNKNRNPRSFYFVKMLLLMVRYDFDPVKTKSIANKFFLKLNQCKLGNQGELETLEVIPYDILWNDLMEKLEKNHVSMKELSGNNGNK